VNNTWLLIKVVPRLRLTYQIRLLTYGAHESGVRLIIEVPKKCVLSAPLRAFIKENKSVVKVERAN